MFIVANIVMNMCIIGTEMRLSMTNELDSSSFAAYSITKVAGLVYDAKYHFITNVSYGLTVKKVHVECEYVEVNLNNPALDAAITSVGSATGFFHVRQRSFGEYSMYNSSQTYNNVDNIDGKMYIVRYKYTKITNDPKSESRTYYLTNSGTANSMNK